MKWDEPTFVGLSIAVRALKKYILYMIVVVESLVFCFGYLELRGSLLYWKVLDDSCGNKIEYPFSSNQTTPTPLCS